MTRFLLSALALLLTNCASPDNHWAEMARETGVIIHDR